jgi:hypothetical protein
MSSSPSVSSIKIILTLTYHQSPRLPSPPPPKKNAKAEIIEEDAIPYAHLNPDDDPPFVRRARRRSRCCWSCKLRRRLAKKVVEKEKPKSDKTKSKADDIEDEAVRDFILAGEERVKELEKPKSDKPKNDKLKSKSDNVEDEAVRDLILAGEELANELKKFRFDVKEQGKKALAEGEAIGIGNYSIDMILADLAEQTFRPSPAWPNGCDNSWSFIPMLSCGRPKAGECDVPLTRENTLTFDIQVRGLEKLYRDTPEVSDIG